MLGAGADLGGSLRHVIIMRGLSFASVGRFSVVGAAGGGLPLGVPGRGCGRLRAGLHRSLALALSPLGPAPLGGVGMPN